MTRYIAIVDVAEDGAFGVSFPDAPGCTAMGRTQEEALEDAAEALAEWVSDVTLADGVVPPPRDAASIMADPDVQTLIGAGGVLVMVPLLLDTGRPAKANISMDSGLLADIDEAARRMGVTRSAFLAAAARDKIKAIA